MNLSVTVNGTRPSNCFNPTAERIGHTIAYCLLFFISLVGNSFIGIIVYKTKALRKPINYLIVNMAVSDLLLPIILFPKTVTEMHVDNWLISGHLGEALCKLVPFMSDLSVAVSIQSLVLIAMDRFVAVVFPLRSPLISSKLCPFFILATWIIAIAIVTPYLLAFKLVEFSHLEYKCVRQWMLVSDDPSSVKKYFMALFIVFFYIPFVLMFILYLVILLKLKFQTSPGEHSMNAQIQRSRRKRNALKLSVAIVLGFAVCWFPFSIYTLAMFAVKNNSTIPCGILLLGQFCLLLSRTNSAMNPCICFILSTNYRRGLKNLFSNSYVARANRDAM